MPVKAKHSHHVRTIDFSPANDFQEEAALESINIALLAMEMHINSRHQKNSFTTRYQTNGN